MWTRDQALQFIAELYPAVERAGYHIGLTGSILTKGESKHDLDLILYPATTDKQDIETLEAALKGCGLRKRFDRAFIRKIWRRKGSLDNKHVESWFDKQDRRIDVFRLT